MVYLLTLAENVWSVCKFLQGWIFVCKKDFQECIWLSSKGAHCLFCCFLCKLSGSCSTAVMVAHIMVYRNAGLPLAFNYTSLSKQTNSPAISLFTVFDQFPSSSYLSFSFSFHTSCANTLVLILDNILNGLQTSAIFVVAVFRKVWLHYFFFKTGQVVLMQSQLCKVWEVLLQLSRSSLFSSKYIFCFRFNIV